MSKDTTKIARCIFKWKNSEVVNQSSVQDSYRKIIIVICSTSGKKILTDSAINHYEYLYIENFESGIGSFSSETGAILQNDEKLQKAIERIKSLGSIAGIVNLIPLNNNNIENVTIQEFKKQIYNATGLLLNVIRILYHDFQHAPENKKFIVSVHEVENAEEIINRRERNTFGISGFINSCGEEMKTVICKTIIYDSLLEVTIEQLVQSEILSSDTYREVVYAKGKRFVPNLDYNPISDNIKNIKLDSTSVIVITGGAKGITAEIASKIGQLFKCKLILIGRTKLEDSETTETSKITEVSLLKKKIIEILSRNGTRNIAAVNNRLKQILSERELKRNVEKIKNNCDVEYISVDVTDQIKFTECINNIYKKYGNIDGIIHGAGVINDKLIINKTSKDFFEVIATKADSSYIISNAVRFENLKFLIFFSSIARFGNNGQTDYSAANEIVNSIALGLNNTKSTKVKAIMWGPWADIGMATLDVQNQFRARGIIPIPPESGVNACIEEIVYSSKEDVEIILGDGKWVKRDENTGMTEKNVNFPFFTSDSLIKVGNEFELIRNINVENDLYLLDHVIECQPVLPMMVALEHMVEAVSLVYPQLYILSISQLKLFNGITIRKSGNTIKIKLIIKNASIDCVIFNVTLYEIDNKSKQLYKKSYEADIELGKKFSLSQKIDIYNQYKEPVFETEINEIYDQYLFHGTTFKKIKKILSVSQNNIYGILLSRKENNGLKENKIDWLLDPTLLDSALQLIIVWSRLIHDTTPLPLKFEKFKLFSNIPEGDIHCILECKYIDYKNTITCDITFTSSEGHVYGKINGMECICKQELNRLAKFESKLLKFKN